MPTDCLPNAEVPWLLPCIRKRIAKPSPNRCGSSRRKRHATSTRSTTPWYDLRPPRRSGTAAGGRRRGPPRNPARADRRGRGRATRSAGPRFFHFVMGGGTPGRARRRLARRRARPDRPQLGQLAACHADRGRAGLAEGPLRPSAGWSGVLTTGATMANFTGLAAARRWWGLRRGTDVEDDGLAALPPLLATETVHVSALKAVAMRRPGQERVRPLGALSGSWPTSTASRRSCWPLRAT